MPVQVTECSIVFSPFFFENLFNFFFQGFFFITEDPIIIPSNRNFSASSVMYVILYGSVCSAPALMILFGLFTGLETPGFKKSILITTSITLVLQALKLATIAYGVTSGANTGLLWPICITAIAADVVVLMILLVMSIKRRVSLMSGSVMTARVLLILTVVHTLLCPVAFICRLALEPAENSFLNNGDGVSFVDSILLLLLAGMLPGIIFYFRITIDGTMTNIELLLSFAIFVTPILLADIMEIVVDFTFAEYFITLPSFIINVFDVAVVIAIVWYLVVKSSKVQKQKVETVLVVEGTAAFHNNFD